MMDPFTLWIRAALAIAYWLPPYMVTPGEAAESSIA